MIQWERFVVCTYAPSVNTPAHSRSHRPKNGISRLANAVCGSKVLRVTNAVSDMNENGSEGGERADTQQNEPNDNATSTSGRGSLIRVDYV